MKLHPTSSRLARLITAVEREQSKIAAGIGPGVDWLGGAIEWSR